MISDAMKVRLRPGDRAILEARLRAGSTEQRQLLRIRIVLEAADGHATREIAREHPADIQSLSNTLTLSVRNNCR